MIEKNVGAFFGGVWTQNNWKQGNRQTQEALVDVEDRCSKVISPAEVHSFAQAKTEEKTLSGDWAPSWVRKKHIPYVSSLITESKSKLLPFSTRLQTLNHEALLCMCMLVRLCVHLVCAYVLAGMFMSFVCFVVVCWHTNAYTCIRRGPIISSVERLIGRLFSSHAYILIQESNRWLDRALWPI